MKKDEEFTIRDPEQELGEKKKKMDERHWW